MTNNKWLVTGGAGFIGSHLVQELLRTGQQVRVADDFSSGLRENIPANIEIVEGDLADPGVARKAVAGCTIVLHQAARPSVPRSVKDPAGSNQANVTATVELLVAARDAGVRWRGITEA
jgi:UDP-glucose 4-epimerase